MTDPVVTQLLALVGAPFLAAIMIGFFLRKQAKASAVIAVFSVLVSAWFALKFLSHQLASGSNPIQVRWPWLKLGGFPHNDFDAVLSFGLRLDPMSAMMVSMVAVIAVCVGVYAYGYMSKEIQLFPTQDEESVGRFFTYFSFFTGSMLGLVLSNDLILSFVFWEFMGLCSYLLIGFWYFKESAAEANKKAFMVTRFADIAMLIGIIALGLGNQTFTISELVALGETNTIQAAFFGSASLPIVLVFMGTIGKSAQVPLHIWLPDAMEGPTPVSALIHAATMVAAGIYMVARLLPIYMSCAGVPQFVAWTGGITALLAATIAIVQNDIKRVLAYSTISQLGFMLAALGVGGLTAGMFHLLSHAFFKALLFLGSGAIIVACHSNDMWTMGGLKKLLPWTHGVFVVGCLALAGIPPFAGFWSKDEILGVCSDFPWLFATLAIAAFLTAFYVTRLYCVVFLGAYRGSEEAGPYCGPIPPANFEKPISPSKVIFGFERSWSESDSFGLEDSLPSASLGARMEVHEEGHGKPHDVSWVMLGPLVILAFFSAVFGFVGLPDPLAHLLGMENYIHHSLEPHADAAPFHPWVMGVSIVIALSGVALGWWLYGRDPMLGEKRLRNTLGSSWKLLANKYYFDHGWAWLISWTVFFWSRVSAWNDDTHVEGLIHLGGDLSESLGEEVDEQQTGLAQDYLFIIVFGLVVLTLFIGEANSSYYFSIRNLVEWFYQ